MDLEPNKKPKRQPLSSTRIVAAALAIADKHGLDGFSFRILANALNCEAMSLYHYFPSKAHLLDAMVDVCLAELHFPDESLNWQDRMRLSLASYRAMALRHAGFFPFISVYRMNSMSGLTFLNNILKIFEASGLPLEARARHFRVLGYYLVGAGLDETIGYANGPSAAVPVTDEVAMRDFPAIISVGRYFGKEHHAATFALGLETLIAQIERDVAKGSA